MAAELKKHLGVNARLIAGHGGVFDVTVDGTRVFSKKGVGRFPEPGEVVAMLQRNRP